ncbi:hypothetical protein FHS52_000565 [Erythromicrobium ramosum]|uniref:Uncharacterized protein n=1 Tax=Erythrobacter ramosus TaxID=35811 RepID=A0ABR6HVF3_9SPHN|nr:hypothetical protein [Erythrobacter ramosus]MBB3774622.1 hypothetical protein [Erythrobacter ramosus]
MTRALALALPLAAATRIDSIDLARRVIVLGCAAALILAGQALPF